MPGDFGFCLGATRAFDFALRETVTLPGAGRKVTGSGAILGTGVNAGEMVDFTVIATDNGEPGTNDEFSQESQNFAEGGLVASGGLVEKWSK